jgi:hypothetical protein
VSKPYATLVAVYENPRHRVTFSPIGAVFSNGTSLMDSDPVARERSRGSAKPSAQHTLWIAVAALVLLLAAGFAA